MRPSNFPSNPAVSLLTRLSELHDRSRPGAGLGSMKVDFGDAPAADVVIGEKLLLLAEQDGAVSIDRPRRARHLMERIRLRDPDRLAAFLGRTPAGKKASEILEAVVPLLDCVPDWIQDAIEGALQRWNRGERAFRIEAERIDRIVDFVRILIAIDRGVDGRDLRTFCLEAGVDSKAFERHRGSIVEVVRAAYGLDGLEADEVIAAIGFRPFHQAIHLRGPVKVPSLELDCSRARPYVAIPPPAAGDLRLTSDVRAILTIENFTSFNRHAAEVDQPDTVVVYSGGFPSPSVALSLRTLIDAAPMADVYHWGDIDAGGVRIFRNIEERVGRRILPHLMDACLAEARGVAKAAVPCLARVAESESGIADLAGYLSTGNPRHLEQEALAPRPVGTSALT